MSLVGKMENRITASHFISVIDNYLLKNHPIVWYSHVHIYLICLIFRSFVVFIGYLTLYLVALPPDKAFIFLVNIQFIFYWGNYYSIYENFHDHIFYAFDCKKKLFVLFIIGATSLLLSFYLFIIFPSYFFTSTFHYFLTLDAFLCIAFNITSIAVFNIYEQQNSYNDLSVDFSLKIGLILLFLLQLIPFMYKSEIFSVLPNSRVTLFIVENKEILSSLSFCYIVTFLIMSIFVFVTLPLNKQFKSFFIFVFFCFFAVFLIKFTAIFYLWGLIINLLMFYIGTGKQIALFNISPKK
jgi:hypothetical protein